MKIKSKLSGIKVILLSSAILMSGCKTLDGGLNNGAADSRLNQGHSAGLFSDSGWSACAKGALGGAVTGALVGLINGNSDRVVKGALIGGVSGCAILMGTNYYLEQQRAKYASKESRLRAYIADVRKDTKSIDSVTRRAQVVIRDNQRTLKNLNSQLKSGKIQESAAKAELSKIDANIALLNDKLAKMKKVHNTYSAVARTEKQRGLRVGSLDHKIRAMNSKISKLESMVQRLSSQRSAIRVG